MAKNDEIDYVKNVAQIENVSIEEFNDYLFRKPFSDNRCGEYLMDIAQVIQLLPRPPGRLLDIGVGSGWTSELFCQRGYDVLGLDISPDMIALANKRSRERLAFRVCDYEIGPIPGNFDAAVVYDALHHSEDTLPVIRNIYDALKDGGILVTVEPGFGHSRTEDSVGVMEKYGTTEKDMPACWQRELMSSAGFGSVQQFIRVSQLPLHDLGTVAGAVEQARHKLSLSYESSAGMTSIVVAHKTPRDESSLIPTSKIKKALLGLAAVHDEYVKKYLNDN
jgi:SAM-dependent methyltransferase